MGVFHRCKWRSMKGICFDEILAISDNADILIKKQMNGQPRVLIASRLGSWPGVLRLPAILRRAGAHVTLLAPAGCAAGRSRFIDRHVPSASGKAEFAAELRNHVQGGQCEYAWVIFGDESTLSGVFDSRDESWPGKFFPVEPTRECFDRIMTKAAFTAAAGEFGVPIPKSFTCQSVDEVIIAVGSVGLPAVLKTTRGAGGDGVRVVLAERELAGVLHDLRHRFPLVVQEYVSGQVGSTQLLLDHGVPICWMAADKTECHPRPLGPSCVRRIVLHPQMESIIVAVGKLTGFHGLCGIDWIARADGSIVVLEFNPRPTPAMHLGPLAGADPAKAIRAMLAGERCVQRPRKAADLRSTVYMFPQHIRRCLAEGDFASLLNWVPGRATHDVPWNEPWMVADACIDLGKRALDRLVGRDGKSNNGHRTASAQ